MEKRSRHVYQFGPFRLDAEERVLWRDDKPVPLTPKVFDILRVLVENSGHIVEKEELLEKVWPDSFVEEGNINRNISTLRRALGDGSQEIYIETVPKRGYRFVAAVRRLTEWPAEVNGDKHATTRLMTPAAIEDLNGQAALGLDDRERLPQESLNDSPRSKRWMLIAGIAVALAALLFGIYAWQHSRPNTSEQVPAFESVAVLPFISINQTDYDDYLSLGMADALITKLSSLRQIVVRPTSAVRKYSTADFDAISAGRELNVDAVLAGSVQRAGDQMRLTVQLLNVSDGSSLWADKFDQKFTDIFSIQDAIAERVTRALKLQITAAERQHLYQRYTNNTAAYELYLQGRSRLLRYRKEESLKAVEAFENALRIDPDYALAHAGLALACALTTSRFATGQEANTWQERAKSEANIALGLDPDLAEAHEALSAVYRYTDYDWERAIDESSRALELNPNLDLPHYHRAVAYYHLGLLSLVDDEARAGLEINPRDRFEPLRMRGMAAFYNGRFAEAVASFEEAQRESAAASWHLAEAYYYFGERDRCEAMLRQLASGEKLEESMRALASLASFVAARGDRSQARELLARIFARNFLDHHVAYSLGACYAQLGDSANARKWLARAAGTGLSCYPWYERDPLLDPLRKDPQFQGFLDELRRSWESAKVRYGQS